MFPQIFGKYVLEHEIASGGMAVVYMATLRGAGGFEKRLVVKQIRAELASDDAFLRRFVAEAKTTVELSHPNIVPVYELGVEQGVYFIAMELAEGVTLAELLKASGPLSPEEGAYLGVEILRALDYAHRKAGIVHRDVTPRNVLIDEEGAVRLIDFGIAAPVSGETVRRERVFGSPGHMPPEQREGGRLTPATDVFAVGALLIEAWTGRAPFRRATAEESDAALRERPPPPSASNAALAPVDDQLSRALAPNALDRHQTAEDFARPLRDYLRSADLGDIARRLGQRVRTVRDDLRPKPASSTADARGPSGPATPVLHTPASGRVTTMSRTPATPATRRLDPVTQTFATREEVVEWTQGGSVPPNAAESVPSSTAVDARNRSESRSGARVIVFAAAILGAIALVTALADKPKPRFAAQPIAASPKPLVPAAPPLVSSEPPPPIPSASALPPPPSPARSAESGQQGASALATFNFASDLPDTTVAVDGMVLGKVPLSGVRRAAGRHSVRFATSELDERVDRTIDVKPGETIMMRALFTGSEPAVLVRR